VEYIIAFLEGIITFVSPCLLPLLPVYLSYFAGSSQVEGKKTKTLINAIGFVLGFSVVFVLMGAFAGTLGRFLIQYSFGVNLVSGIIVILFGLNFIGIIKIPLLNSQKQITMKTMKTGVISSFIFGIIFSIGWTPCVGAFLGSALMMAASSGESLKGILMLSSFCLGLGVPFLLSAILIDKLKSAISFIKRNYKIINIISGSFLVLLGILMATGFMGRFLSLLSF